MKNNPMKNKISKRIVLPFIFLFVFVLCGCNSMRMVSTKPPFSSVTLKAPITLKVTESVFFLPIVATYCYYIFPAGEYRVLYEEHRGYSYCPRDKIQVTYKDKLFGLTLSTSTKYLSTGSGGIFTKRGSTNPTALWLPGAFSGSLKYKYNFSKTNVFELKP